MAHPIVSHWNVVTHILWYLQGTIDFGIIYSQLASPTTLDGYIKTPSPIPFQVFTNADWAAYKASRRSIGGYIFTLTRGKLHGLAKDNPPFPCQ